VRVQVAASGCCVASGLFLCGLGGALALAQPSTDSGNPAVAQRDGDESADGARQESKKDSDVDDRDGTRGGDDENGKSDENGGNPGNGNCGNGGSNGNAQGCGTKTESTGRTETKTSTRTTTKTSTTGTSTTRTTTARTTTDTTKTSTSTTVSSAGLPSASDGGGRGAVEPPSGRSYLPPEMRLPANPLPLPEPGEPVEPVTVAPGVGIVERVPAMVTLPVIVAPSGEFGGAAAASPLPRAPRVFEAEPRAVTQPEAPSGLSNASGPAASYRFGYSDYLRTAGMTQVIALAAPGLAGMLVMTGAGGPVGYRQAKAGQAVRTGGYARFVN
jgi:hypothetical protein